VQQAPIIHHQQLAGIEQEADLELRRAQQLVECAPCTIVGGQLRRRQQRHEIQPRTEVHCLQPAGDVELDRRRAGHQLGGGIAIAKSHRGLRQHPERLGIARA